MTAGPGVADTGDVAGQNSELRVVTGNMQHGHPLDVEEIFTRPEAEPIEAAGRKLRDHDVLLLNEVDRHQDFEPGRLLAERAGLQQVIDDTNVFLSRHGEISVADARGAWPDGMNRFGNAVALRADRAVTSVDKHELPVIGTWSPESNLDLHKPRNALAVTARIADINATFITAHLTPHRYDDPLSIAENEAQFLALVGLAASTDGLVVVGGDFNLRTDHRLQNGMRPHEVLEDAGFTLQSNGPTHLRYTDAEIDYLCVRANTPDIEVVNFKSEAIQLPISDHRFVRAEISLDVVIDLRAAKSRSHGDGTMVGSPLRTTSA